MHAPAGDPFDFHRFRLSTEETLPTLDGGLCGVFGFWFCVWGLVGVFVGGFLFFSGLSPPSICSVSYPSTMTWAHRPHGVRTRGKTIASSPPLGGEGVVVTSLPSACALDVRSRFVAALSVWLRWAPLSTI